MVDMAKIQPNVLRIGIAVVISVFLLIFLDPLGMNMSSLPAKKAPGQQHEGTGNSASGITHIVMFQFKRDANPHAVEVACNAFLALKDTCFLPNSARPYVKSMSGGKDNSPEGLQNGMTHAFVMQFDTADERSYYLDQDPAHQEFKKNVTALVEKVTVVDFTNGVF
ncbi:stress responsive A/B barrel domain-containing protein [Podospora didyma]|uniref:Stress responsive A/B barrel domain-containing protein n=1 Tax=Podospora didyma TaxID=330526 RepID=A0AAE0N8V9_9PEZI|nr:stress responsive A/B barrel domain-containing protein [Podospora didyma]